MNVLLPLERKKPHPLFVGTHQNWKSCKPFVENRRGHLIHRPRCGATINYNKKAPHVAIKFWCGMTVSGKDDNFTFHYVPPEGAILCERCEAIAVKNSLPSADSLAECHVHKGGCVAVITCCDDELVTI